MAERQAERSFLFVGDNLCLDFINTEIIEEGRPIDLLGGVDDLTRWAVAAHLLDAAQARELARRWSRTRAAEPFFGRAVQFRAVLREMVARIAAGRTVVPPATLTAINDVLGARIGALELKRTPSGYETRSRHEISEPVHLLVPIAESAAALLTDGDLALVRKCQGADCILYFYDTTKNHARRWCSMTACGNRAKVAAHYRRTRQDASRTS